MWFRSGRVVERWRLGVGTDIAKDITSIVVVLTVALKGESPPSVDRVALTVCPSHPGSNCPGWPRPRNSLTLNPVLIGPVDIRVLTSRLSLLYLLMDWTPRLEGTRDWSAGGAAHQSKGAARPKGLGVGLSSPPKTRSQNRCVGQELLGKGAGMKGLRDFKGNSQNFENGKALGARAFRDGAETWAPGQEREAAWGMRPGRLESPGSASGVSPSFPGSVMGV